jgi:hypothetical protein
MRTRQRLFVLLFVLACFGPAWFHPVFAHSNAVSAEEPPPSVINDAFVAPPPPPSLAANGAPARPLSQFLAGHVAVRLVLPESTGTIDPSTEDWTPAQIQVLKQEVQQALDWWAQRLPLARLHFTLEMQVAPTAFEPINHNLTSESRWISDSLANLGFHEGSYFDQAYAAGNELRQRHGSDWATTIFVVNSANNSSGRFTDRMFAYAYIGGPFTVLTSDVAAYGQQNLSAVLAHEIGHLFGALDQYAEARISCHVRSGYLDAATANSDQPGCPLNQLSIMRDILGAYTAGAIDPSALAQIGYRDSDSDGLIDPLDTTPAIKLPATSRLQAQGRPRMVGRSVDIGFPSPLQQTVSLNRVVQVEYRANGGTWQRATPEDGAFYSVEEGFVFEPALYDGNYTLELRAVNNLGIASPLETMAVTIEGLGPQPTYAVAGPQQSNSRSFALELSAPPTTQAMQISEDGLFNGADWQPFNSQPRIELADGATGERTLYVRFKDANGITSMAYEHRIRLGIIHGLFLPLVTR